jgi:hypothetical protein|tara:strand:- start:24 stop:491 length:468 start_codon:yes stop_codon:yes gene_type:complete
MAIQGVSRQAIPFVPEEERMVKEDQSVIWIKPKTGHAANVTMSRYASAGRDGRKGYRELNVTKLDNADLQEFIDVVVKWENYYFSDQFPDLHKQGLFVLVEDEPTLRKIAMDLSADLLIEIMEAANNISILKAGEKKKSSSSPTLASGKAKKENG